jgi:hypothetical protein
VIVAGARNAAISMVVRVFGLWSGASVPAETGQILVLDGGGHSPFPVPRPADPDRE